MKKLNKLNNSIKNQKGFLSILSIVLIIIISFIIASATYQFTTDALSAANQLNSAQAFYLSQSGIEAAKHYIITNNNSCTSINGASDFTGANYTGSNGVYTVTGSSNVASSTLNSVLLSSIATTIPLANTSGFTSSGEIKLDSEYIYYTGLSGNNLTGAVRGVSGTTAATHILAAAVSQNQCILTSVGYSPNSTSPLGQRTLESLLAGSGFSYNTGSSISSPTLVAIGNVSLSGNGSIVNPSVTSSSPNFAGSTIVSGGTVSLSGNSNTEISNGLGGLVTSSSRSSIKQDVEQNASNITSANLFGLYFNQSKSAVQAQANQSYNGSNVDGVTGKLIWMGSSLSMAGNTTIGSAASPVILIVNGSVSFSGNSTIYGLLYATGTISFSGNGTINGVAASESSITGSGNTQMVTNSSSITSLLSQNFSSLSVTYSTIPAYLQELTP